MKSNEAIAILMRKINLPSGLYLYIPITHIIGDFNIETNVFTNETDSYSNIEDDDIDLSQEEYVILKPYSYQGLIKKYNSENNKDIDINIEKCIESYIENHINIFCFLSYNFDTNKVDTLFYNSEDIFNNKIDYKDNFEKEKISKSEEINDKVVEVESKQKNDYILNYLKIEELFNKVTSTVIAQDEPTRRLILEICRMELMDQRNGILLTGSTGVGKTELIKTIGKYIDREVYIVDSTQLTTPGYVGLSIEEVLFDLYKKCKEDKEKAENSIIVFDEIDKKGSQNKNDVGGRGVLNTLLKFLDGTTYKANENDKSSFFSVDINTSKMIVIASGAFTDVYKNLKTDTSIGFNKNVDKKDKKPSYDDFCKKAMIPDEFMGRFPIIINLNTLSIEDLKKILLNSDKSCLKKQKEVFKKCSVTLKVTEDFINEVAKRAYELKTGARSLSSIINEVTWLPLEQVMKEKDVYSTVQLTKDTVNNSKVYKIIKKNLSKV